MNSPPTPKKTLRNYFNLNKGFWDSALKHPEFWQASLSAASQIVLYLSCVAGVYLGIALQVRKGVEVDSISWLLAGALALMAFPSLEEKFQMSAHKSYGSRLGKAVGEGVLISIANLFT